MIIAVDTGNKQIKTSNFEFVSGLLVADELPVAVAPTEYIEYQNKYYVQTNRRGEYSRDKSGIRVCAMLCSTYA